MSDSPEDRTERFKWDLIIDGKAVVSEYEIKFEKYDQDLYYCPVCYAKYIVVTFLDKTILKFCPNWCKRPVWTE